MDAASADAVTLTPDFIFHAVSLFQKKIQRNNSYLWGNTDYTSPKEE